MTRTGTRCPTAPVGVCPTDVCLQEPRSGPIARTSLQGQDWGQSRSLRSRRQDRVGCARGLSEDTLVNGNGEGLGEAREH